jgi:prepilin-type N-terminal cleavage/methylation domain-containing protein/prepilin-type processing-associated H-X9-DG protein
MNSFVCNPRTKAFTLVEMLVVCAIIGILAALLLPVLNGGQRRAQRIVCENSLRQTGIAFHVFSNDHTGRFPMDVSTNEGGSMEYIQSGYRAGKIFYTAFRTFQVLSNELVRPDILACPADLRRGAPDFTSLQNSNISYFIGASGTFDKPTSLLAGDRNLMTNAFENPTILQIGPESHLSWSWEMHRLQGNVVFADTHVEEWNQSGLKTARNQFSPDENLFLPSVPPVATPWPASPAMPIQPAAPMSSTSPATPKSSTSPNPTPFSAGTRESTSQTISAASGSESSPETITDTATTATNATVAVAVPGDEAMSAFDRHLTKTLQHTFEWLYLLLLLLVLLYFLYRRWRKRMREQAKLKARQLYENFWEN